MIDFGGAGILWVLIQTVGLALLAATVSGGAAFGFRLYTQESIPEGASLILGLGTVGLMLNTRNLLAQFLGTGVVDVTGTAAAIDVAIFVVAAFAASAGRLLGDRAGASDRFRRRALSSTIQGPLGRATRRTVAVTLPSTIDDIDGYDPVAEETKRALEGATLDVPRGPTAEGLKTHVRDRLKREFDVGYVDVDIGADGDVEHLGLGRRPAGLGPTIPSDSVVIAVPCDPAVSASPGDVVQLWRRPDDAEDEPERVATGELRAIAGAVATVVVDERVAPAVDPTESHRLVTLPSGARPEREFVGMLRRADETLGVFELPAGSPLVGNPVGAIRPVVIGVRTVDGTIETLPAAARRVEAGEAVIVLGDPAALRQLQTAAGGTMLDPSSIVGGSTRVGPVEFAE